MIRIIQLVVALLLFCEVSGQQVFGEIGRTTNHFVYQNSKGEAIDGLRKGHDFGYRAGYRKRIFDDSRLSYSGAAFVHNYSALGGDELTDQAFSWRIQYAGISAGADFEFVRKNRLAVAFTAAAEPQFLLKGVQTIGGSDFELKGVEEFDRPFLFGQFGLRAIYCADTKVAVSFSYNYGVGRAFGKTSSPENLKMRNHVLSIGLFMAIKNCPFCGAKSIR